MAYFSQRSRGSRGCSSRRSRAGASCPYGVDFWPRLEEKADVEHEPLLEGLVEKYYGPCSVLADASEEQVHVEHEPLCNGLVEEYEGLCDVVADASVLEAE